jgi:hypothetical protein
MDAESEADDSSVPDLFEIVPTRFFRPLGGPLARLYWKLLARLYTRKFEGSPAVMDRDLAVAHAENILVDSPEWLEGRETLLAYLAEGDALPPSSDEIANLRGAARRLVARLEECKWLYFEFYREAGEDLSFYPYAARLLSQMMAVARDDQPVFPGYAHAVTSELRPDRFAQNPGTAINNVKRQTLEFARELRILHGNINDSILRISAEEITTATVLRELLDRYQDRVRRNYNLLKTRDNIYGWRIEVLNRIAAVQEQRLHLESAAAWNAEQHGIDVESARTRVAEDLELIRRHIEVMPRVMGEIDDRNERFTGAAARRVGYLLRHEGHIEAQLQAILDALGAGRLSPLELDLYRVEVAAGDVLRMPRRRREVVRNERLRPREESGRHAAEQSMLARIFSPYRKAEISRQVLELLSGRRKAAVSEVPLSDDHEYLRLVHIVKYGSSERGVAFRFFAGSCMDDGRDCGDPACELCRVRAGRYSVPNGRIERVDPREGR